MTKYPTINYIGNKDKIAEWICSQMPEDVETVFDAFSGGASVSYMAKKKGYSVISNDIMTINYHIAKALVENNIEILTQSDLDIIFAGKPKKGFMTKNYSNVFYYPEECSELDLYISNIQKLSSEYKKSLAYIILRRAMVRKMPYSRFTVPWNKIVQLRDEEYSYAMYGRRRAYHNKSFKEHFFKELESYNNAIFKSKNCKAHNEDIFDVIEKVDADLVYLDPPYIGTMNNYFSFYGVLDEMIKQKKISPFENNFMDKKDALSLFERLFSKLDKYNYWMLSYNNSSSPTKEQLLEIFEKYKREVQVFEHKHDYKITGKENKTKNVEYLFVAKKRGV